MDNIDKIISKMSLKQKIGQIVCIRAFNFTSKIERLIIEGNIGALGAIVINQQGKKDIEAVVETINHYYSISKLPLLLYIDAECGITDMFDFGTPFPQAMALGATFSKELAYKMGSVIAKEARALGFSIICSPVLDINNNPDNPIISIRAFSDNPDLIVELAGEYVKGMQDAGIIPTGKHFPGHGDTSVDSHISLPVVEHDVEYLMNMELKPFKELIRKGMLGVMTAHIIYPALLAESEGRIPATLSKNIITNLLRNEFGFEGIIISDSLAMKGIKDIYGIENSAVLTLKAGHDIVLQDYSSDPEITLNALVKAVESGEISETQVDESIHRILKIREELGNIENKLLSIDDIRKITNSEEHVKIAEEVAEKSITILEAKNLPFTLRKEDKVLILATRSEEEGKIAEDLHANIKSKTTYLFEKCKEFTSNVDLYLINENPDEFEMNSALVQAAKYDYIIYAAFIRVISYKEGSGTIPNSQIELIYKLNLLDNDVSFIIYGSPYIMGKIGTLDNCIVTYSDCEYSLYASLKVLFGKIKAQGKLPVYINKKYHFGYGL